MSDPSLVGDVTLLHCTSSYPAPAESVNLRAMDTLGRAFGLPVGYSDHTEGTAVAVAAVARGATVIEKHLTTDMALPGPDHAASLEPPQFKALVEAVRNVQVALGTAQKEVAVAEAAVRTVARRGLVAARDLDPEDEIGPGDFLLLRPEGGLTPSAVWDLEGRRPSRPYHVGEPFYD
jgi:N-acetylneuraminate synthase